MATDGQGSESPRAGAVASLDRDTLGQRAVAFARSGQTREAVEEYGKARRAGYAGLDLPVTLASLLRQQGFHDDALRVLESLGEDERADQRVLRELGAANFAAGNYEAASRTYDAALENINLAAAKRGDIDDLIRLYEGTAEAARESGNQFRATILYANLADYLSNNGYKDRASDVRALADANARASEARRAARAAEPAAPKPDRAAKEAERRAQIDDMMAKAYQAFAAHKLHAAIELCQDIIRAAPGYMPVHFLLAEIYIRRGRFDLAASKASLLLDVFEAREEYQGAADACRLLLELQPENLELRRKRITFLLRERLADEAVQECWTLVQRLDPKADAAERLRLLEHIKRLAGASPEIEQAFGEHYAAVGQAQAACEHFLEAADGYRARGAMSLMEGVLRSAREQAPDDAAVRERYADCLLDQGRLDEGIQELVQVSELYRKQGRRADSVAPLIRAAQTYEALEDMQKTIETYDLLLRLAPENAVVRQHFINFSLARGRTAIAARTLRSLTDYFVQRGNVQQAIASLTQLISLKPDDPWSYVALAELLQGQGAIDQAARVFERYLQRHPRDQVIQKKLQALRPET